MQVGRRRGGKWKDWRELREEVGVKATFRRKLVRSLLTWVRHVENGRVDEESACAVNFLERLLSKF